MIKNSNNLSTGYNGNVNALSSNHKNRTAQYRHVASNGCGTFIFTLVFVAAVIAAFAFVVIH